MWVQHNDDEEMPIGSSDWNIVDDAFPADGEPRIDKRYGGSSTVHCPLANFLP